MDLSDSRMMNVTFDNDLNTFTKEEEFSLTSTLHTETKSISVEQEALEEPKINKSNWKQSMLLVPFA